MGLTNARPAPASRDILSGKQRHDMVLDVHEMDWIVYSAIRSCGPMTPTREEIAQLALDHIKLHISEYIMPSIERLVKERRIIEDSDGSRGRPYVYRISPFKRQL
jgi:hypothetical protein